MLLDHIGYVHKRREQSKGTREAYPFRLKTEGDSTDVDIRTFCFKILKIFRNLWCARTNKEEAGRGVEAVRTAILFHA